MGMLAENVDLNYVALYNVPSGLKVNKQNLRTCHIMWHKMLVQPTIGACFLTWVQETPRTRM
jgi:hypothetical protein